MDKLTQDSGMLFGLPFQGETKKEVFSGGGAPGYYGSGRWPDNLQAIGCTHYIVDGGIP